MALFDPSVWKATKPKSTIPRCGACGLYKTCAAPKIAPGGKGIRKVLLVGDMPSAEDDMHGGHFMGGGGSVLRGMLQMAGVRITDCQLTTAIICRPQNPSEIEPLWLDSCQPNINNTIARLKPNVIIPLGFEATRTLISQEWGTDVGEIGRWAGWRIPSDQHKAWVCPTYHPLFVKEKRDDPAATKIITDHLRAAFELEHVTPNPLIVEDLERQVEVIKDTRLAAMKISELSKKSGVLAWDYESNMLKPESVDGELVAVSFCLDGKDTFACLMADEIHAPLKSVLTSSKLKKVGSNIKFEHRWTRTKLGYWVVNWWWDTMLSAHVMDNRSGITSVKFQAFCLLGLGRYNSLIEPFLAGAAPNVKNRIRECSQHDMLKYCGMDSLVEYLVAVEQRKRLGLYERIV